MIKSVSALVMDGLAVFEFGVICEVFGIDRSADGVPNFDFKVCGPEPGKAVRTSVGATITPDHGLDDLIGADLVAIPAISSQYGGYLPEALGAVRKAAESGSIILTVCSGAFLAGAAGLLDGRPCTTHWMHADELAQMYPTAKVDRNVLFVDDGNLITSAGTAAGIDACLHLVRRELGSEVTNKIARRMVVPPQRDGGQRQYIDQPIPVRCSEGFAPHLDWILTNLDKPHTVATLATRAHMSARTFARRFPTARVDRNVLFVDDGNLITSAGTAAGIDACLHLVRRELGSEVTNKIARRMVVPPQRDGGQRQYIDQPIPVRCSDGFAPHLDWILTNLEKPHTVATLATRAHMSARTFARRFVEETGRTPMQWVTDQRVLYARRLLEESDLDIDRIADRSGFGTATLLRHHFRRIIGVTPTDYRRRFSCNGPCEEAAATA